jgi:hypothetical protein
MSTRAQDFSRELFDFMADTIRSQAALLRAQDPAAHLQDADCRFTLKDDVCTVCGVGHGEPCPDCGGRGFHRPTCPTLALTACPTVVKAITEAR